MKEEKKNKETSSFLSKINEKNIYITSPKGIRK
jgi:hypothetical protein